MTWRIATLVLILLAVQSPWAQAARMRAPESPAPASMPAGHCDHAGAAARDAAPQAPVDHGGCCDGSDCCGFGCAGACAAPAAIAVSIRLLPVSRTPVLQTSLVTAAYAPVRPPDPFRPPI